MSSPPESQTGSALKGRTAAFEVRVDEAMLDAFAQFSGDRNPIHMSAAHAARLGHRDRVAHGMLMAAFVSRLIGEHLPGGDVLLLSSKISFHQTVHPGDVLRVEGTIEGESPATRTLDIRFAISVQQKVVCKGTVLAQQAGTP